MVCLVAWHHATASSGLSSPCLHMVSATHGQGLGKACTPCTRYIAISTHFRDDRKLELQCHYIRKRRLHLVHYPCRLSITSLSVRTFLECDCLAPLSPCIKFACPVIRDADPSINLFIIVPYIIRLFSQLSHACLFLAFPV